MKLPTLVDSLFYNELTCQEKVDDRQAAHDSRQKTRILEEGEQAGNVSFVCRRFGISRDTYYRWKRLLAADGKEALINSKSCPENPKAFPVQVATG